MEENLIKVYVQTNSNNVITCINSSIFITDSTGWTQIDEGTGDKYAHAQSNYLDKGLVDSSGKYNYRLVDGKVVELTDDEKASLFPELTPQPSLEEQIKLMQKAMNELILGGM